MINERYVYVGYSTGRSLYEITDEQAKRLTHLNVAFGIVKDGKINIDRQRPFLGELERIRKSNPDLNILLSTGGGDQHGHGCRYGETPQHDHLPQQPEEELPRCADPGEHHAPGEGAGEREDR